MPAVLASLLDPVSPVEFREQYYGRAPLLVRGNSEKFRDLFSWIDLNSFLNASVFPHPRIRVSSRSKGTNRPSTAASLIEQFREGATICVEPVHEFSPKLGKLARSLEAETGEPIGVNLYVSQPLEGAFDRHHDYHDVVVLQIDGSKRWSLFQPTTQKPQYDPNQRPSDAPDVPILECDLTPGDLLYVPRGYWHEVVAHGELSLHLSVIINMRTGVDFLTWFVGQLGDDVNFRQEMPLTFDDEPPDVRMDRMHGHVSWLAGLASARMTDPETTRRYRRHRIACHRDGARFKFPAQLVESPSLLLGITRFSRSPYQPYVLEEAGDELVLTVWGRVLRYPETARRLLEFILTRTSFDYETVLGHAELAEPEVRSVLDELLREGIVDPADDPGDAGRLPVPDS